ncbi:MAG: response regulator transcription factor [Chloroflexota bacterium]|nr:response regulator transcription factor [Chloroflexota bacterium]
MLLVDDHELVRVGLRTLLSTDPEIEVLGEAAAGSHAIAIARLQRPDVVLLDAHLPDLSGPDVCRRLRAAVPDAVIAMLTTFTDEELVRDCVRAGAQGYLLKDIAQLDLSRSIKALARGEAVIDPKVAPLVLAAARLGDAATDQEPMLTARQREVLQLVAEGLSNREIAARTHLSELTVKSYVEEILLHLGARNRVHAAILATKHGWI